MNNERGSADARGKLVPLFLFSEKIESLFLIFSTWHVSNAVDTQLLCKLNGIGEKETRISRLQAGSFVKSDQYGLAGVAR
jgi:hypothetical protein